MKGFLISLGFLFVNFLSIAQGSSGQASGKMELLSPRFSFQETSIRGHLENAASQGSFAAQGHAEEGFAVRFTIDIKPFKDKQTVLDIPGILTVDLRLADPQHPDGQNYPAFKMKDGSVPVLEASIVLHSDIQKPIQRAMRIGFPLAMLSSPMGEHEVVLNFIAIICMVPWPVWN